MEASTVLCENLGEDVKSFASDDMSYFEACKPPSSKPCDVSQIELNLSKVETVPLTTFAKILGEQFTKKADILLNFFDTVSYKQKALLAIESKRIVNKITINPFSEEQCIIIDNWTDEFITKKMKKNPAAGDIVKNYITPWIIPFMYGRTTLRKGRHVPLLEAVNDMIRVCARNPIVAETWMIPYVLQECS